GGAGRAVHRRITRMLPFRLVDRPTGMLARVDAIELAVMDRHVMDVALVRQEGDGFHHLAGLDVILHHARSVAFIAGRTFRLKTADLPDKAVVVFDAMHPGGEFRDAGFAEHELDI